MKFIFKAFLLQASAISLTIIHAGAVDNAIVVPCGGGYLTQKCEDPPFQKPKTDRYPVRCCSESEFPYSKKRPGCNVYGGSLGTNPILPIYPPYTCSGDVTYDEAVFICDNVGAKICTSQQLFDKCAKSTGCQLNKKPVWALSEVPISACPKSLGKYNYTFTGTGATPTAGSGTIIDPFTPWNEASISYHCEDKKRCTITTEVLLKRPHRGEYLKGEIYSAKAPEGMAMVNGMYYFTGGDSNETIHNETYFPTNYGGTLLIANFTLTVDGNVSFGAACVPPKTD